MSDLITVIVPVYNVEPYLEECLDSLVHQTVPFDEIILINDGSTDRSCLICNKYCEKYPFLQFLNQDNMGQGAARNRGLKKAKGDYIIFVDSDDYVDLQLCEKTKKILNSEDLDVLYYNAEIQYDIRAKEAANAFRHLDSLNGRIMSGMEYFNISFPGTYIASVCISVYKRCFLEKNNIIFPEGIYYEDHFFCLQVITNAEKILCIPDSLYIRRCRENSVTTGKTDKKRCCDMVTNQRLVWGYLSDNDHWFMQPDLLRRFIAQMTLNAFYTIFQCTDKRVVNEQKKVLVPMFLRKWLSLFFGKEYSWGESLAFLLILQEMEKLGNCIRNNLIKKFFGTENKFVLYRQQAESVLRRDLIQKLFEIPLNRRECKVGIYGTGKHTIELIEMYQQYFGKIECELLFIVTVCGERKSFLGRSVISCNDLPADIDCFVLSSMTFQEEMLNNLLRQGIEEKRIISFYKKDDICDLVMVNQVLNQLEI